MTNQQIKPINWIRAIWLFVRIVWREWHGAKIDIKTAWEVSSMIWLESKTDNN